mgnify:CR=1 FL=1
MRIIELIGGFGLDRLRERDVAVSQPLHFEELFHEVAQPRSLLGHCRPHLPRPLIGPRALICAQLRIAEDRCRRRPKLVGRVSCETPRSAPSCTSTVSSRVRKSRLLAALSPSLNCAQPRL